VGDGQINLIYSR